MKYIIKYLKYLANNNLAGNPFSACIVDLQTGAYYYAVNKVKELKDPTAHAEIIAIRELLNKPHFNPDNCAIISSSEPCPMCLTAIAWSGIKLVMYLEDYTVAIKKGFKFDRSSKTVNKVLNLGLKIRKYNENE